MPQHCGFDPTLSHSATCHLDCRMVAPLQIELFCNKRTISENHIGVARNQMAFGSIPGDELWVNHALPQLAFLVYDLLIWFQRMIADSHRSKERPNTLLSWFISVAARLIFTNNTWVLALSAAYLCQQEWKRMEDRLADLSL